MDDNELQFVMKMQDQTSSVLNGIEGSFKDVSAVVQQQMAAMQQLTAALQAQAAGAKNATSAAQAHAGGLKAVGDALKTATSEARSHEAATKSSAEAHGKHADAMHLSGEAAREAAEQNKNLAGRLGEVTSTAKEAVEAMIAIYATNEMAKASIEASEELEHTIRDIGAAAGVTRAQVTEMLESLNKKASSGFAFSGQLERLAKIGATLTSSTEQIEQFAVSLGKISSGSNFQEIGNAVAQLIARTNEGPEKVEALADALGKLGLSARGGVTNLAEISNQIARFTAGMNISSQTIVGYAATFNKLQLGSMLQNISKEARDGGEGLKDLASRLGMTYEAMRKLGAEHPDEVFQKILQVTDAIKGGGGNPADFLKQFGLGDGRALQQIEAMAEHFHDLQQNIKAAQNAAGGADAFNAEQLTPYDVAVRELSNAWKELKEAFGADFTGTAITAFTALTGVIKEVTALMDGMPEGMRQVVAGFIILAPAIGGAGLALGAMVRAFRELKDGFITFGGALSEMGSRSGLAAAQVQAAATKIEGAATLAASAEHNVALAAVETEAVVKRSWGNMALAIGSYMVAADAAHQVGLGIADLIKQQQQFGKQGISWKDEALGLGAMLPDFMGGSGFKSALTGSMRSEKRQRDSAKGTGGEEHEHQAEAHSEAHNPTKPQEAVSSEGARNLLAAFSPAIKAAQEYQVAIEALQTAIDKMSAATKEAMASEIQGARQALELRKAELDPLNKMTDQWRQAMMSARAYTKAQQEAAAIEKQVFDAREAAYKRGEGDAGANRAEQFIRTTAPQTNRATSDTDFAKEAQGLQQALAMASAVTQTEKDRLGIVQQIANLARDKTYTQGQLDQLKAILELTKQWERELSQLSTLNPQLSALTKYNNDLKELNSRLAQGRVSQEEFNREKTALDQQTLAARNPIGKIAQDQGDELAQLQVVGKYREADLKTLQEITDLKRQGVSLDKQTAETLGSNNRMLQDVKEAQQQLDQISQAFGDSLSQALKGALSGNRHALSEALAGLGGKLFDMGFQQIMKSVQPGVTSLFPGLAQNAEGGIGALGKLGAAQAAHTIASASQEIASAQINIANATMAAGLTGQGAQNAGAPSGLPGPAGTNLPGSTGEAGAPTQLPGAIPGLIRQPLTPSGALPNPSGLAQVISPGTAAAAGGVASTVPTITSTGITNVPSTSVTGAGVPPVAPAGAVNPSQLISPPTAAGNAPTTPVVTPSGIANVKAPGSPTTNPWGSMSPAETAKATGADSFEGGLGRTPFQLDYSRMATNANPAMAAGLAKMGGAVPAAAGGASPFGSLSGVAGMFGQGGKAGEVFGGNAAGVTVNPYTNGPQGMPAPNQWQPQWNNMPAPSQAAWTPDMSSHAAYLTSTYDHAKSMGLTDEQARVTAVQGGLESGYGAKAPGNNYFGMKAGPGFKGPTTDQLTREQLPNGQNIMIHDRFRRYDNYDAGQQAHQDMLQRGYPDTYNATTDEQAISGLQHGRWGSYATDHRYPNVMRDRFNELDRARNQGVDTSPTGSLGNAGRQAQEASQAQMQQAMQVAKQTQDQMKESLQGSTQAFSQNFQSLSGGIKGAGQTALGAVPDMGSFSNSISEMVSKIGSSAGGGGGGGGGFGGLFGGGGGGGGFGDFADFGGFEAFHSGGKVGSAAGGYLSRRVSRAAFIGAPRFHDGLSSDEFPAILQRGERVLTNTQEQKTTSIVDRLADAVASKGSPNAPHATPAAQRAAGARVNMVVNVKDANSFRLSQSQIMAQAHSQMVRSSAKHN
jgi:hypothetical protein